MTLCYGVNHTAYDAGEAPRHLERFLHHELPGAGGQGPPREVRYPARPDDHRSRLYERPTDPGPAAHGPAPGAGGRNVDDPHDDRGRARRRRSAARPQGQARRNGDPRPDAERLDRGPDRRAQGYGDRAADQRRDARRGRGPAQEHPGVRRRGVGVDRLQRLPGIVHRGSVADQGDGRELSARCCRGTTTSGDSRTGWWTSRR